MCDLLAFRKAALRRRREPLSPEPFSGDAEIIIFPGVRYMRMSDYAAPPKRPRAAKRRDKAKKEKAS